MYLAKKGMKKARDIIRALKLTKQQFYPTVRQLKSKGIVTSTLEHPARFSVIPFEKVLDMLIKEKMQEAQRLQQTKDAILSNWQNLKFEDDTIAKFTVIEGRSYIYSKIQQMIQETKNQILTITTIPTLIQTDQRDILDLSYNPHSNAKISFRFLAELTRQNVHAIKAFLRENESNNFNFEGRNPDLGATLFPQMLIKDEEEAMFFVKPRTETSVIEKDDVCLWTDCKTLVKAFTVIFEDLWRNSTNIKEKIIEIETGKLSPKMFIIADSETAKKKYNKILMSAEREIIMVTHSESLIELWNNKSLIRQWNQKGATLKIMAPIIDENLNAANQLNGDLCSIKHVPPNYLPTTIVDGKHLFQFKNSSPERQKRDSTSHFENAFYTNNSQYIQKTLTMLNEIWKTANIPSADTLKTVFGPGVKSQCGAFFPGAIRSTGPSGTFYPVSPEPANRDKYPFIEIVDDDPLGKMTEQDVLNEIITTQKNPPVNKAWKFYSSQAVAIVHPPDFFNLPPMLIRVHHIEKHSTSGEQEVLMISSWLETPHGPAYVPVAVLVNNVQAKPYWEKHFSASPAGQNVKVAKKGELQIRVHGNTLFAGWTVPISLAPTQKTLPPACILIEGYGDIKTAVYTINQPWGGKFKAKQNGFDAFVTFIHPSSKYSGPGTDGFFIRDFVGEVTVKFAKEMRSSLAVNVVERNSDENETNI
jgi:sugar-specific transcriptional regulator TrmB